MADKSFEWAKAHGLWRQNAIHGEEEAKLVTEETFKAGTQEGWQSQQQGAIDMPESCLACSWLATACM